MSSGFPSKIAYPDGYDSVYSLFQVYNTTETTIVSDNVPFASDIPIRPVPDGSDEIWADNGYATISGELLYYDSVGKNSAGHVCSLRRCIRNIGGEPSQYNVAGTWIRGFVVAEHHNQLVDCILNIEEFVGENFSLNPTTLDWRIRHLEDEAIDDTCPSVDFTFEIVGTTTAGTLVNYALNIVGVFNGFTIQFGDGSSTQSGLTGTHLYSPGATIDPSIVVTNGSCQIVQTPITRTRTTTPVTPVPPPPFAVPSPVPPQIPPIIIPSIVVPAPVNQIPPVIFPCITPQGFPSVIIVSPPINIPSQINITPVHIPSVIIITPPLNLPNQISVIMPNPIPPQITFPNAPDIPDQIQMAPAPAIPPVQMMPLNIPPIQVSMPNIPPIKSDIPSVIKIDSLKLDRNLSDLTNSINNLAMSINNGFPSIIQFQALPKLEVDRTSFVLASRLMSKGFKRLADRLDKTFKSFRLAIPDLNRPQEIKVDWGETPKLTAILKLQSPSRIKTSLIDDDSTAVEYETIDFPSEIKIAPPDIPPIQVIHDIPESIRLISPDFRDIKISGPDKPLPTEIRIMPPTRDMVVSLVAYDLPDIKLDIGELESLVIPVIFPAEMPILKVDMPTEVKVVGMVDTIELKYNGPSVIDIRVPENTRIPLFYDGPPLPVTVSLSLQQLAGEAVNDVQCVQIVPCKPR